jgi:hypothetical protein
MIDRDHILTVTRQAELLGIGRGSVYYLPKLVSEADLALMVFEMLGVGPKRTSSSMNRARSILRPGQTSAASVLNAAQTRMVASL